MERIALALYSLTYKALHSENCDDLTWNGKRSMNVVCNYTSIYTVKLLLNAGSQINARSLINAAVPRPVF